jgi:hypothetical protein
MRAPDRRRTVARPPVRHGIELGGSVSHAGRTGTKRTRRRTHLGWRGRLARGGDGARHGEAERCSGATPASPHRSLDARGRQQVAPGNFSPPCAAPG